MILAICVVVDESKCLDIPILEFSVILEHPPFFMEEFFLSGEPSSSAAVRVVVIHDIKEVEGERQQEVKEDKGDEEIGSEANGEVEESHFTHRAHET